MSILANMKYWKECNHCGNKIVAHVHRLNKGLVIAFCIFRKYSDGKPYNPNTLPLTHNQKANRQKLQYFALVQRVEGGWVVTDTGNKWFKDEVNIYDIVATMDNEVLPMEHEAWETHKTKPKLIALSNVLQRKEYESYKTRADYQAEMPSTERLKGYYSRTNTLFAND